LRGVGIVIEVFQIDTLVLSAFLNPGYDFVPKKSTQLSIRCHFVLEILIEAFNGCDEFAIRNMSRTHQKIPGIAVPHFWQRPSVIFIAEAEKPWRLMRVVPHFGQAVSSAAPQTFPIYI